MAFITRHTLTRLLTGIIATYSIYYHLKYNRMVYEKLLHALLFVKHAIYLIYYLVLSELDEAKWMENYCVQTKNVPRGQGHECLI